MDVQTIELQHLPCLGTHVELQMTVTIFFLIKIYSEYVTELLLLEITRLWFNLLNYSKRNESLSMIFYTN